MTVSEIKSAVRILLKTPQICVPYIKGKPGVGKSDIIKQLAKEMNISFIDLRLSQLESCDTRGIPHADIETESCKWFPPEMLPFEKFVNFKVPGKQNKGKMFSDGGILFLDEINRAKFDVIQSIFELVLDRKVGLNEILENWFIVCAGNLGEDDNTEVTELNDAALNDRFIHFTVDDAGIFDCWKKWAEGDGNIHRYVIGFLTCQPSDIYTSSDDNEIFATPRSWEKMSQLIIQNKDIDPLIVIDLFAPGLIGPTAHAFRAHVAEGFKISPAQVVNDYDTVKDDIEKLERPRKYSISNEIIGWVKENCHLDDRQIGNIHKFYTNHVDKDHMIAAFKSLIYTNIIYKGKLEAYKNKETIFMDPYLDLYDEMNTIIAASIKSARE